MTNREKLEKIIQQEREADLPTISLYMPTHRTKPDNMQDPIQFKNLLQDAEKLLVENYPRRDWEDTLNLLYDLHKEVEPFWQYNLDGLAVLATGEDVEVFRLRYAPEPRVFVGDEFHIVELLGMLETYDEITVANISKDRVKLYNANRYGHESFEPDDFATSFEALFDDFDDNASLNFGTYGGNESSYHGHRARPEEAEKDRDKYYHYLDDHFAELNRKNQQPILLAGTKENVAAFRQIANENIYLDTEVGQPIDSLEDSDLQEKLIEAMQPLLDKETEKLSNQIVRAQQSGLTSTKTSEIEEHARNGRIGSLIVDRTRVPNQDQTLDEAVLLAIRTGAEIHVLHEEHELIEHPYTALLRY